MSKEKNKKVKKKTSPYKGTHDRGVENIFQKIPAVINWPGTIFFG